MSIETLDRPPVRARRSQESRSAATQAALLDATIESLIEVGWAAMSTTDVVSRAGVSRGAQVHHYPRKVDLVEAAMQRLQLKTREEVKGSVAGLAPDVDKGEVALALLWGAFRSDLFFAMLELMVAARTDESLKPGLRALQLDVNETVQSVCVDLYGPGAEACRPLQQAIDLSFTFMHGLGSSAILNDEDWQESQLNSWKQLVRPFLDQAAEELRP